MIAKVAKIAAGREAEEVVFLNTNVLRKCP